jgi:hypothetical protein
MISWVSLSFLKFLVEIVSIQVNEAMEYRTHIGDMVLLC